MKNFAFLCAMLLALPLSALRASAADFDPSLILTDAEIRDDDAMSYPDVVFFLREKGGLLQAKDTDPKDGFYKDAAQLIVDSARHYRINPKYIMAVLQKESSVVESPSLDPALLIWAAGYALCDGCYRSMEAAVAGCPAEPDPAECLRQAEIAQKYKGFGKQVDAAAGWMDWYLQNAAERPCPVGTAPSGGCFALAGTTLVIDGVTITPRSSATAALYSYTPHLHGNELLWQVLQRWFGDSVGSSQKYPNGTVFRDTTTGEMGVIQAGKLRVISNLSVLASRFGGVPVAPLDTVAFGLLKAAGYARPLSLPDLTLARQENGAIYLLVGSTKRHITSMEAFRKIGFNPEEVEDVRAEDLAEYADGAPIDAQTTVQTGALKQDPRTGGVYFVRDGAKHPLWDRSLLTLRFGGLRVTSATAKELDAQVTLEPVTLPDGAVVKAAGDPTVYLVGGGERRAFADESAFHSIGYKWTDVVTVNPKLLALHRVGAPIVAIVP